jgi:hypothetical protein
MTPEEAAARALIYMDTDQAQRENKPGRNEQGFERIGDALKPLAAKLGMSLDVNDVEPTLDDLRGLRPTTVLAADVQRWRGEELRTAGRSFGLAHQQARSNLKLAELHLRWGQQRDAIRASRPPECNCLGDGKVIAEKVDEMQSTATSARYVGRGFVVAYCPCEDGQNRRAADSAARRDERAVWAERRLAELFDDTTRVQLGEYVDYTIEGYIAALDGYPLDEQARGLTLANRLREWPSAAGQPWLFLYGDAGTGKTGFGVVLARMMAERGHRTLLRTHERMLEEIQATYNGEGNESTVLDNFRNVPVLVLDELGVAKASEWAERKLTDVLNARYTARRRTAIISNLDAGEFEDWAGPRIATRVFQRTGLEWTIEADGPNLRVQPGLF